TVSGNITVGAVTIDTDNSIVRVPVTGGTNGSVRVDGIRIAIAGTNASVVSAKLSWAGQQNILSAGDTVTIADQVRSGLSVDPMTDTFLIYNNTVLDSTAKITLREGYASAFVNTTDFGQNTPTKIRIRVTDFPTGLTMRFPTTVTAAETGATLTT